MSEAALAKSIILFGAFDRHNLGDLLFPHIAAALLPGRDLVYAGLARRDLRRYGGHEVRALPEVTAVPRAGAAALIHVGGEILTCSAWQAAVMLLPPPQVQATVAYLEARPQERLDWVCRALGTAALAPYVASRQRLPGVDRVVYAGVGGVGLAACDPPLRCEVLSALGAADHVGVRDRLTLAQLVHAGIPARLIPDPAVMVADLFGARIGRQADQGEVAAVRRAFPRGYLAVQFSADFGDDVSLGRLAAPLERAAATAGLGVVLFRAGAAPWHDDLDGLQRLAARLPPGSVRVFSSLVLWDLCALIACSRGYCGSSLHGRVVAMAFARPRVSLRLPGLAGAADKTAAFAATWDEPELHPNVDLDQVADGIGRALATDPARLRRRAAALVGDYRRGFEASRRALS
ncbi:MAG: polysaccharide pyruvyl transferase family protein [Rubrivivax sp.]|nr:polysaccharide pyruvyl transferase family protein [Rubrivivax sp.]